MMKKGDAIRGYVLTTDAQNGGGHCEWAFARKDGEAFFIKRFLQPTYPVEGSPGSERTKADKLARSEEFDRRQRQVIWKLCEIAGEGGNLVVTREFFREGAHFYKVTLKVDVTRTGPKEIAGLPRDDRILIMLTAAKSLETLHRAGLVHGDVKPDNLLVKAVPGGGYAIKVIDFDNCFAVNHPAPPAQLVGDLAFYSPELYRYHVGDGPNDVLDDKNDVFALGLVFWQYLTGDRPPLPPGKHSAAHAVVNGVSLSLPDSVRDVPVAEIVDAMLAKDAGVRPSMSEVHSSLKVARKSLPEGKPIRLAPRERVRSPARPGLKGKLFRGRMGFAPVRDGDAGAAMPSGPVTDADAPSAAAASGRVDERLGGTLMRKAAAGADAPADTGASPKLGGTLMRKTAAEGDAPDRADVTDATEKRAVEGKLRGRLPKRRE